MKKLFLLVFLVFPILGYLVFLIQFRLNVARTELNIEHPKNYYDYKGVLNVHSNLSTGSESPLEIIQIANELNFDFIMLTEMGLSPLPSNLEGYHGRLLTLVGGEYTYLDSNIIHYNLDGIEPPVASGQSQVFFTDLISRNTEPKDGITVLTHPFLRGHSWRGEYPKGFTGLEIINLKRVLENAWEESKISTIGSLLIYPFNPHLSLIRIYSTPQKELKLWDKLNKKSHVVGLFAPDATARAIITPSFSLKFPSYKTSLAIGSNHLLLKSELTGDFDRDREKIARALFDGKFYMALDIIANPKGFYSEMTFRQNTFSLGSTVKFKKGLKLVVHLPDTLEAPFEIIVYRNGDEYAISNDKHMVMKVTEPGVYRSVVRVIPVFPLPGGKRWLPWIYTNPIFVKNK